MRIHKTSVLIVNSKGEGNKMRQIPSHIVKHWRKYVFFFMFLILLLMVVSGFMIYQNTSEQYKEKLARANHIRSLIDIKKANTSFQSIDESIYRINRFLQARGLQKLNIENMGGGGNFEITDINEVADYYNKQVLDLEKTLQSIPLGNPYEGEVTSEFGYRRNPLNGRLSEFHPGIDMRGAIGDTVRTTGSGTIVFAGYKGGYGRCVIVQHEKKLQTLYGHLHRIDVKAGEKVTTGQLIGRLGNSGRSTGPHVHYEMRYNNQSINPKDYIQFDLALHDEEQQ